MPIKITYKFKDGREMDQSFLVPVLKQDFLTLIYNNKKVILIQHDGDQVTYEEVE